MKIETMAQLIEERKLCKLRMQRHEQSVIESFDALKKEVAPFKKAIKTVSRFFSSEDNSLIGESISLTIDNIIRHGILRKSGFLTRFVVSFLAKNISKNYFTKRSGDIVEWVSSLFKKDHLQHQKNGKYYDASTAGTDMEL